MRKINSGALLCLIMMSLFTLQSRAQDASGEMSATWPFSEGTAGQVATLSDNSLFALNSVEVGSNLEYYGSRTEYNVTFTEFQPLEQHSSAAEDDKITFSITPQKGITFTPTSVYLDAVRIGTDGGLLDIYLVTENETITLATGVSPNRNGGTEQSQLSYSISGISTTEDVSLVIYLYNLGNTKQVGIANIQIAGTYEGVPEEVTTYTLTTGVSPEGAGTISQSPIGSTFNEGTKILLTANENFGYNFINWTDENGDVVSEDASFTLELTKDETLTANYEQLTTYSLDLTVDGAPSYMVSFSDEGSMVDGKRMYEAGTEVQLSASNNAVYTFTNWSDGSTSSTNTIKINGDTELSATYSNAPFICGWDFYNAGSKDRAGDIYNESTNAGMLSLRLADGTTNSWLDRSTLSSNPMYEGRYGIVNWKPLADHYYYEATFSTKGYYNIHVQSAMLLSFNGYSVQKLQWSTDDETFYDYGEIDILAAKTWYDNDSALPEEAEDQDRLYIRWIPDYDSDLIGTTSDNDGTAMSAIFILADQEVVDDYDSPVLKSSIPADGATGISASGSIVLNFDEVVQAGEGDCTIGDEVLTDVTYSGTTVLYRYNNLDYSTSYTVTIPAGAIVDRSGNVYEGTTISFTTMDRNQPEPRLYDAVVAQDGTGDYTTVIDAIEAAPTNRTSPWLIFIKDGYYKGHFSIPSNKPYIYLIGQDKEKVVITDELLCGGDNAVSVSEGASVVCQASDFYAENISFENEYGVTEEAGPQALALYTNNDRACLYNCKLRSYQDTYLSSQNSITDRHYIKDCFIEGAVDFIYGAGDVYFDECTINIMRESGGYIVAPDHRDGTKWGYVFDHNTITAPTTPPSATSVWLGRPWHYACKTVFLYTTAEVTIPAAGWYETMGTIPAIFADYKTMDADGNLLDLSNRRSEYYYTDDDGNKITGTAKNSLTDEEAATYTYSNILSGDDYWNPRELMESVAKPENVTINDYGLTWDAVDYAMCYVVLCNDVVIGFTTDTNYALTDVSADDVYKVQAANEYGSLGEISEAASTTSGVSKVSTDSNIRISRTSNGVTVSDIEEGSKVEIITTGGSVIYSLKSTSSQCSIALSQPGVYIIRVNGIGKSFVF
ncbi:MAG: pectinesterase family protein [Prevotella sp.]|nr:pectinesterase family protein [Prevotella sp.]